MSRDGGFQAVRAIYENLQIRTLLAGVKSKKKNPFGWCKIKKKKKRMDGNLVDPA
jgi:hypothetical protein